MKIMKLKAYFDAFPRGKRGVERRRFAEMHKVSEVTVRSWANENSVIMII